MLTTDTPQWPTCLAQVESAIGFSVQYFDDYKVVTNSIADEVYVLYQCGRQPPATLFPNDTHFFQIPLTSLSAPETVPYAFVVSPPRFLHACIARASLGGGGGLPAEECLLVAPTARCLSITHRQPPLRPHQRPSYPLHLTLLLLQELLGLDDRVYDVSPYVTSACGQKLLGCRLGTASYDHLQYNETYLAENVAPFTDGMVVRWQRGGGQGGRRWRKGGHGVVLQRQAGCDVHAWGREAA
jgi:hypothetical protein